MKRQNLILSIVALVLVLTLSAAGQSGAWTSAGKLVVGVDSNNAFPLSDGRVVSVGIPEMVAWWAPTTQIWSPGTNTWKATSSVAPLAGLVQPVPVMLNDGRILVTGFCTSSCGGGSNAEIYDPANDNWSLPGQMAMGRYQHNATKLADGRVLVAGGCNAYGCAADTSRAEIFDPGANSFTQVAPMVIDRADFTATLLTDGRVLVAGGFNSTGTIRANEIYDPTSNLWTANRSMKFVHALHVAALLHDGRVLVAGGDGGLGLPQGKAEVFDPLAGTWTAVGSMGAAREYAQALTLSTGKVLISGGSSISGRRWVTLSSATLFDPTTNQFTLTGKMKSARESFSMTVLQDGRAMVVGGNSFLNGRTKVPGDAEIYMP